MSDTLAGRLAHWAQRMPGELAIGHGATRLTWRALDDRAGAIAAGIAARLGAGGGRVALLLDDRAAIVTALLAVLRSGHACVVLDPDDPAARLRFIASDAAPALVVTDAKLRARAEAFAPAGCVVAGADELGAAGTLAAAPPRVDPASLATITYTSGSTGQPKGVCHSHATQMRPADAFARRLGLGPGDRMSSLYSLAFAAGQASLVRAIASGATTCCYDLKREGIGGLADWLDREQVSVLQIYASMLRDLSALVGPARVFGHLRLLQLSGDTTFAEDLERASAHTAPHCRMLHQLASTELNPICQNLIAHGTRLPQGAVLPVGRAFEGVRLEVRRDDGSPAAVGEAGQVLAFARQVSPGYWRRPELDAKAFIPDPLDPGGRGYRTGDLGSLDAEGVLHLVGRSGSRVKVRGHTVDLAEVDAGLVAWPAAARAAIMAEPDPADATQVRLVAYVAVREGARRDARGFKAFIASRLPRHMMPAEVRFLAALPCTPSGKVDRNRLAAEPVLPADAPLYVPPRDATEAAVAHMFAELLKLERAGRDDDFFLAGGDSLVAADLQARIKDAFGVRLAGFHEDATVAGIAASIHATLAEAVGS